MNSHSKFVRKLFDNELKVLDVVLRLNEILWNAIFSHYGFYRWTEFDKAIECVHTIRITFNWNTLSDVSLRLHPSSILSSRVKHKTCTHEDIACKFCNNATSLINNSYEFTLNLVTIKRTVLFILVKVQFNDVIRMKENFTCNN